MHTHLSLADQIHIAVEKSLFDSIKQPNIVEIGQIGFKKFVLFTKNFWIHFHKAAISIQDFSFLHHFLSEASLFMIDFPQNILRG